MRLFAIILLCCLFFTVTEAGNPGKIFPTLKHDKVKVTTGTGDITYVKISKSINGPFTSSAALNVGDSLFVQVDVSPLGTVYMMFYIDINENGVLDTLDLPIGDGNFVDNGGSGKDVDLDPNPGIIVVYLETGEMPEIQIIAIGSEGQSSAIGRVSFYNLPLTYTLSGYVYTSGGDPIGGAMVFVSDAMMNMIGDASDLTGYYSVPIDAGTYGVIIQDWAGRYTSFDTMMTFADNTVQNFYLKTLTSYIRGYVKDELANPLPNVQVWAGRNSSGTTDSSGMYKIMVSPGTGNIGVHWESVLPNYMMPNSHFYSIADNDSIVNNSVSNFVCYSTNATITGKVTENGGTVTRQYMVSGWCSPLESSTMGLTDVNGDYTLHIRSSAAMEQYGVNLSDWGGDYPMPPGMYADTNYWGLTAGAVANFNLIPAETLFVEPFMGDGSPPSWTSWNTYNYNNPWGPGANVMCWNNRLTVQCNSIGGLSGLGVVSQKPFSVQNIEYKIIADPSQMSGSNNTIKIILSDENRNWEHPQNFRNSLQLIWEKSPGGLRQWRLVKSQDDTFTDLCTSSDSTGYYILFQFIDPDILRFKIGNTVYYEGQWGNHFSLAYLYLTEFNLDPNEPTPVYFDEISIGALGTNGVREVGGELPAEFKLDQNYPNPFNPITAIRYHVPSSSFITLKLFNTIGQEVMTLVNGQQNSGNYEVAVNADRLPSGVYYYRLIASEVSTGKLITKSIRKAVLLK